MTKTLNQIIFVSSTKIRIFFSAILGIRIFKKKKKKNILPPPPFKLNGPSLTRGSDELTYEENINIFKHVFNCIKSSERFLVV